MRRISELTGGSVRARMTLLYGGLFSVITVTVLIVAEQLQRQILGDRLGDVPLPQPAPETIPCDRRPPQVPCSVKPYRAPTDAERLNQGADLQQAVAGSQRLITVLAIIMISVLAFAVCWWLTGRLLRPLHRITATARRLSLSTLDERIALTGPQNELKELADTFDAMLDRLEHAIASQRRFVANASHELRTPLAIQRTALEIGLANPTPDKLARIRAELLRNTQRSERLIEGLLLLAQGERGLDDRAPVDLRAAVEQVLQEHRASAEDAHVTVTAATQPVTVAGDEVLLTRLIANLVQNAIRHNHPGGHVLVELSPESGLVVCNSGPLVPEDRVAELFEPFRRLAADRTGSGDGAGLGLSIVSAIAQAHGGQVRATPNPDGGLTVTVAFPVLTAPLPQRSPR